MSQTDPGLTERGCEAQQRGAGNGAGSLAREIARLRRLTVAELVPIYQDLHGAPPRSKNHSFLWRRCAWKVQERALGGLSETAKRRLDELVAEIEVPDRCASRTVTARLESRPTRSEAGRQSAKRVPDPSADGSTRRRRRPDLPPPGTTIVREWRGRDLRLTFLEEGVEVEGTIHPSLTAAARAITGSKWNGRLFWLGRGGGG